MSSTIRLIENIIEYLHKTSHVIIETHLFFLYLSTR